MKKEVVYSKNKKVRLPYILFIPDSFDNNSNIIVNLNTTYVMDGELHEIIDQMVDKQMNENGIDRMLYYLLEKIPSSFVIIPIIPRIRGFYTTYLGSSIINNDFSKTKNLT